MQFKQIKSPLISDNGEWIAYEASQDRGNGEAVIKSTLSEKASRFTRGYKSRFSKNGNWVLVNLKPDFAEAEKSKEKLKDDLLLFNTLNNDSVFYKSVKSASLSNNSEWAAILTEEISENDSTKNKRKEHIGLPLIITSLKTLSEDTIDFVTEYQFDSLSTSLAFTVSDTATVNNGLYFYSLADQSITPVDTSDSSSISNLTWKDDKLIYLKSHFNKDGKADTCDLMLWNQTVSMLAGSAMAGNNWYISSQNKLEWSKSGKLIYFGYKKVLPVKERHEDDSTDTDIFNFEKILSETTLDIWHWNDPLIKTNEKNEWKNKKKHLYTAVYNLEEKEVIRLTDESLPDLVHNGYNSH